jgi:uncharacterized protein YbjT (DUF2867 family)
VTTGLSATEKPLIFVTGATGYVGGRLVPSLLSEGYGVKCLAREPRKLQERPWRNDPHVCVVPGDMSDIGALAEQLSGCEGAYYLVHSMEATGGKYAERDRQLASNFGAAAAKAGVRRIIYLGGLGEMGDGLSEHLRSRRDVEDSLACGGVPVTTIRAAMIIGSGSASFEILRYLVERLPVMVTPSWVKTESQPVAISDVLYWLAQCMSVPETTGQTLEIGGPDVLPYRDLMRIMADELHLPRRIIVPLPLLTPKLSSLWISLVTPVSYRIARPLGEGLRNRVVVTTDAAQRLMPHAALSVRESIHRALHQVEVNEVETRWTAAGRIPGDPKWSGGKVFTDRRSVSIHADAESVFAAVCRIGGGNGWYAGDILWRLRGWMDTLVGGPGLRRGRRNSERVEFGEALDFWRVIGIDHDRSLALLAEMKLPGTAMLNFQLKPEEDRQITQLEMIARFRPKGLIGIFYWYAVAPLHNFVFGGMLKGIRSAAEARRAPAVSKPIAVSPRAAVAGYGRARLWLGISAVGTIVTLAIIGLASGFPSRFSGLFSTSFASQVLQILAFVGFYMMVHLPFDLFGGYFLPRRFGRQSPPLSTYLLRLGHGALVHGTMLFTVSITLTLAGRFGGIFGSIAVGALIVMALLAARVSIARLLAPLSIQPRAAATGNADPLPVLVAKSEDEGFTGGIAGVLGARFQLVPRKWEEVLCDEGLKLAERRRVIAVASGGWRRGRIAAVAFTLIGLGLGTWLTGSHQLGTAQGTIRISLWFTLWSFLGLLTLPTLSRRGVVAVDELARAEGWKADLFIKNTDALDRLQDGEPTRPFLVETIFHPIPSVQSRLEGPTAHRAVGLWDVARSAIFLSMAGLGLLGRAVHCNCGRPSLWVFLPTE